MKDHPEDADLAASLIAEAEAAEAEWARAGADRAPVRARSQASDPSQVYSVRIPVQQLERLRSVAERRGMKPTVLMREWVLERLAEDDLVQRAPEVRLAALLAEAQRLADVVRQRAAAALVEPSGAQGGAEAPRRTVKLGAARRLASPLVENLDPLLVDEAQQVDPPVARRTRG